MPSTEFDACAVALALKNLTKNPNMSEDDVQQIANDLKEMVSKISPDLSPGLARIILQIYDAIIDSNISLVNFSTRSELLT